MPNKTSGNYEYLKDFKIKVVRARTVPYKVWVDRKEITLTKTLTTIKIEGQVKWGFDNDVELERIDLVKKINA